jgi:hypothetical protein
MVIIMTTYTNNITISVSTMIGYGLDDWNSIPGNGGIYLLNMLFSPLYLSFVFSLIKPSDMSAV